MIYQYLTEEEKHDILARALIDREREHYHYEMNRLNYEQILNSAEVKALPAEWPANLQRFKGLGPEQLAIQLSGEDYATASALQFRDHIQKLHKTTCCEQGKCEGVYKAVSAQLPNAALVAAAIARVLAKEKSRTEVTPIANV